MISINPTSKVFVYCIENTVTGGAELLHQLVHVLNEYHIDAYVTYHDWKGEACDSEIPHDYSCYKIKKARCIDDDRNNVVVLYEAIFDRVKTISNAQVIFWWMSVDNFYFFSKRYLALFDYMKWSPSLTIDVILFRLKVLLRKKGNYFRDNISVKELSRLNVLHCYQSEYAHNYLLNNGFYETLPLKDFLNDEIVNQGTLPKKGKAILYNPQKGLKFTKRLMKRSSSLKWVPLQNMKRNELVDTLRRSMLYVDFGHHPGQDRLPREAAISGCCVVTGLEGSARFFEDVPIGDFYKIDQKPKKNIKIILQRIETILEYYDEHIDEFKFYRETIARGKDEFYRQVKHIFSIQDLLMGNGIK